MNLKWKRGSLARWSSTQVKRSSNGWPRFSLTYSPLRSIVSSSQASGIMFTICANFLKKPHTLLPCTCCYLCPRLLYFSSHTESKIICRGLIHNEHLNRLFLLSGWIKGEVTAAISEPQFRFLWAPSAVLGKGGANPSLKCNHFFSGRLNWPNDAENHCRKRGWTI